MSDTNGNGQPHPLTPAGNGRTSAGTFAAGNRFGRGNPVNRRAQALRSAYIKAVSRQDLAEIVGAMVKAAKAGDVQAAKEVCDRVLGKAVAQDLLERIEALEANAKENRR